MQRFVIKPDITLYSGIKVEKDTVLEYETKGVKQSLKNLEFRSVTKREGQNYESVCDTVIHLSEGDILLFEEEGRGYIKPVEPFVTITEAINDYENIKDLG